MKRTNTWIRLHLFQKFSLLGLVMIGVSLPVSIILSAYETHIDSKAAQEFTKIQIMHRDRTSDPRLSTISMPKRYIRYPIEASISGIIKPSMLPTQTGCMTGGCSGELCLSATEGGDRYSTCEWKESYACLKSAASCEVQSNGQCGWTYSPEYYTCLKSSDYNSDDSRPKTVCGNNLCELLEADQELCTRSLPPQCRIRKGTCNEDCTNPTPPVKPTVSKFMCARKCAPGYYLSSDCDCVRARYQIDTISPIETREPRQITACERSGGETKLLSGCGDSCDVLVDSLVACPADSQQESCDCGPNQCWNGNSCVKNPKTNSRDSLTRFGFSRWFSSFFELFQ